MKTSGSHGAVQDPRGSKSRGVRASGVHLPPARAANPRTPHRIQAIKAALHPGHYEVLCRDWLPDGKKQGDWWVTKVPWREDHSPSLGVSLTTGRWQDFARGDHGDVLDLAQKIFDDSLSDVLSGFETMLGIQRERSQ